MTDSNCVDHCPFADDNQECDGQCATRPKLETLDQVDIDQASHNLIIENK
ncbi:MAG TPA: hypothetical protein VIH30_04235 [Aquirhabdus sp.]